MEIFTALMFQVHTHINFYLSQKWYIFQTKPHQIQSKCYISIINAKLSVKEHTMPYSPLPRISATQVYSLPHDSAHLCILNNASKI